jgi:uncharacterized protein YbjT (DUF2867 family)
MKVTVLGATDTAGPSALPVLSAAGHEVHAHARTDAGAEMVTSLGATPARGDTDAPAVLRDLITGSDAVIDLRVAIPPTSRAPFPWVERAAAGGR